MGMFGIIWSSKLRAHKTWAWSWGIAFVGLNLVFGIVYFFISFSIPDAIGFLFNIFVMYALITEGQLFFPVQPDLVGQQRQLWRTLIVPFIVAIILTIVAAVGYYFLYYSEVNKLVPQSEDNVITYAVITDLANASSYAISNQNNFKGYTSTVSNDVPKCSSPLIDNISPDGSEIAIFGQSCMNPAVYYCSNLSFSIAFLGTDNNASMKTIPAQFVSSSKYDCSPASTSPATISPISNPAQSNTTSTFPAFGPFTDDQLKTLIADFISDSKKFYAAKGTYSGSCNGNSFNATDTHTAVYAKIPIGAQCDANSDAEAVQLSNGTWWCQDTSGFAGTIKYSIETTLCSQSDAFHEKYGM